MNLGLRPSNFEFIYEAPTLLKRDLLYFDQIHVCSFNNVKVFDDLKSIDSEYNDKMLKEFEFLKGYGLLCDFNLSEMMTFTVEQSGFLEGKFNRDDHTDMVKIMESFFAIPKPVSEKKFKKKATEKEKQKIIGKYIESINKTENEATRIASVFLNRFAAKDKATAILQNNTPVDLPNFKSSKVLEVILEKLPIPDENVEWQQIVEYRADPDSSAKFTALRVWMQDISSKELSKQEIEERIDHLINEYERHMSFHKLKYQKSAGHILLNAPLEILENLITFKWSSIGKAIFSFKEKQFDLMEAELKAPGRELAYISKVTEKFV
jgi:hypothetical protein